MPSGGRWDSERIIVFPREKNLAPIADEHFPQKNVLVVRVEHGQPPFALRLTCSNLSAAFAFFPAGAGAIEYALLVFRADDWTLSTFRPRWIQGFIRREVYLMEVADHCKTERTARVRFFSALALQHLAAMRLLFRGGKLWKKAGWRNVVEHCLLQVAVADALGELLELPNTDTARLRWAAAIHDWSKRLDLRPEEFTESDRTKAQRLMRNVRVDHELLNATSSEFLARALLNVGATWLERLQFYVDDICMGAVIVSWEQRIAEAEQRKPELNGDNQLTLLLGGPYWQKERELCKAIEDEIFALLRRKGAGVSVPSDVPEVIRKRIRWKMQHFEIG